MTSLKTHAAGWISVGLLALGATAYGCSGDEASDPFATSTGAGAAAGTIELLQGDLSAAKLEQALSGASSGKS